MFNLRKTLAIGLMTVIGGAVAHVAYAQTTPAVKEIVIVHGALVDASGWHAVHDILTKDGFRVTIVQEPNTSFADDVDAIMRVLDQRTGPVVLVGHSYAGSLITETGGDPKVSALVYVAALQPDVGEASGQLLAKFAAPKNAMQTVAVRAAPQDKYLFLPAANFREDYAADVAAPEAQFLADSQQPLAQKALGAPVTMAAWRTKPSYAILTTRDHTVGPQLQGWMYQRSGSKVTKVSASHAVFVSHPDVVARVIEAAAAK